MRPRLTIECPEEIERKLLLYWDNILKPQEGEHPDDVISNKRYRKAIKVLLEFFPE